MVNEGMGQIMGKEAKEGYEDGKSGKRYGKLKTIAKWYLKTRSSIMHPPEGRGG
jgi:hypothetical protein